MDGVVERVRVGWMPNAAATSQRGSLCVFGWSLLLFLQRPSANSLEEEEEGVCSIGPGLPGLHASWVDLVTETETELKKIYI